MSEKRLKETWKFFPRVSKYVHWQSGSIKREGAFGNLGGAPVWGIISCSESRCLAHSRKLFFFLVFPFSPTFFGCVYFQQKQGHLQKKPAQVYHCFKNVQTVFPVVSVSLSNLLWEKNASLLEGVLE